jgi:hypothetical protein
MSNNLPPSKVMLRAVMIAEKETWVRETDGKNDSPRIREYQAICGIAPPEPYCACFVAWAIVQACKSMGCKLRSKYFNAYTPTFYNQMPVKLLSTRDTIQRGDLFFEFKPKLGRIGHVGFVRGDLRKDGMFPTIEGNTNPAGSNEGDGVYLNERFNSSRIIFARITDDHIVQVPA